jgi:translocator protein
MDSWYAQLKKPNWAPPETLFGQVWSVLYPIIFFVNAAVVVMLVQQTITWKIALPFWINLFFNFLFTFLQFGLKNQLLASIDILFLLATTIMCMVVIWPYSRSLSLLFLPYAVWVLIATALQLSIAYMNK